jgi:intracellular sulfur oxidation DsrE/DsrF family protein
MQRRRLAAGIALTATAGATVGATGNAAAAPARQRVVYHVGDEGGPDHGAWRTALGNMRNHLDAVGEAHLDLACVLNAAGVRLLLRAAGDPALAGPVAALRARGARFLVCANSLRGQGLAREALFEVPEGDIVPAGVVELARLQAEGFAYIRP